MANIEELKNLSTQVRRDIVRMVHAVSSGHPGGSLGCVEYLVALYKVVMKHDPAAFTMDGKNEDTWFDELDINPNWKKNLKRFNLSPEVWNVICRLHYGETIALKQSMEEQLYWIQKYNNLKKNIKNLLD